MRAGVVLTVITVLWSPGCGPESFTADLPRVSGSNALLFVSSRIDGPEPSVRIDAHEFPTLTGPTVVLASDLRWPEGVQYEFVAAWLPGSLAPSGIKSLVRLGDGALFIAQAPPGSTASTAFVWVRPEHYPSL